MLFIVGRLTKISTASSLQKLPYEVKAQILKPCLVLLDYIPVLTKLMLYDGNPWLESQRRLEESPLDIFLVCRDSYMIGQKIFYSQNHFVFQLRRMAMVGHHDKAGQKSRPNVSTFYQLSTGYTLNCWGQSHQYLCSRYGDDSTCKVLYYWSKTTIGQHLRDIDIELCGGLSFHVKLIARLKALCILN